MNRKKSLVITGFSLPYCLKDLQRTRYFQTVSLDGKETPLDFYRSGEGFEDTWDEVAGEWVPTTSLTHMLIRGDVALDEIDYDPTTRLGDH